MALCRLRAKGWWGPQSTRPLSFNLSSDAAFAQALKSGNVHNLRRHIELKAGEKPDAQRWEQQYPLRLHYDVVTHNSTINGLAAWGGGTYLDTFPEPFQASEQGLGHTRATTDASSYQYSNATPLIPANAGHTLRLFLFKSPAHCPIFTYRFGGWQFQVIKGQPHLMRLKPAWTQAQEDTLVGLLQVAEPDGTQQAAIDTARAIIYADYTGLSLGRGGEDEWYGTPVTVTFLPEQRGAVTVALEGGQSQIVPHSGVAATRTTGTIWPACNPALSANGGAYIFQTGYPRFVPTGYIRFGRFATGAWTADLGSMVLAGQFDQPTGTTAALTLETIDSVYSEWMLTLSTSNDRLTPYAYTVQANITGGARLGSTSYVWDSNDHLDANGEGPFLDVNVQHEGLQRRQQFDFTLRDATGNLFSSLGHRYEVLENRLVDIDIDGVRALTNGIVKTAALAGMKKATENLIRTSVAGGAEGTQEPLTVCDMWAVLEEQLHYETPIGDGLRLNDYLRLLLMDAGIPETAIGISGYPVEDSRKLPTAALGEAPCVMPDAQTSRADWLRQVVDKYAMGLVLCVDPDGLWRLHPLNTGTPVVAFTSGSGTMSATMVLAPLDSQRDTQDSYNYFCVVGADDPVTGQPIMREVSIYEGWNDHGGMPDRRFIGRRKPYPIQQDSGLRTADDVAWVLRSLVDRYGGPPRYFSFRCWFNPALYPGQFVTLDGILCYVTRMGNASLVEGVMELTVQEVVAP